jgi:hypothetical protein
VTNDHAHHSVTGFSCDDVSHEWVSGERRASIFSMKAQTMAEKYGLSSVTSRRELGPDLRILQILHPSHG